MQDRGERWWYFRRFWRQSSGVRYPGNSRISSNHLFCELGLWWPSSTLMESFADSRSNPFVGWGNLLLFDMVNDWALREATQDRIYRIQLYDMIISDLDFADDVCLLEDDFNAAQELLSSVIAGLNHQCQKDVSNVLKPRARKREMLRWRAWKCKPFQLSGEHNHRQQRHHQSPNRSKTELPKPPSTRKDCPISGSQTTSPQT